MLEMAQSPASSASSLVPFASHIAYSIELIPSIRKVWSCAQTHRTYNGSKGKTPDTPIKEAAMIDHMGIKVKDFDKAAAWYTAALAPLGYTKGVEYPGGLQLRIEGEPGDIWIQALPEGADTFPVHVATRAKNADEVKAFYEAALAAGGKDNGAPGPRDYFPGYYAAFVYDPEGNNIEAMIPDYQA